MSSTADDDSITGINVTPLVDVVLVLLVVFMVSAKLILDHKALDMQLPSGRSGNVVQETFAVEVNASGTIDVSGRSSLSDEDLLAEARAAKSKRDDLRAVIKADGAVPHRRIVRVLDLLRQAGVSRIGFAVVPEAAEPPPGR